MVRPENAWQVTLPVGDDWHHHFVCNCGHADKVVLPIAIEAEPLYACPRCCNRVFLDALFFEAGRPIHIWKAFRWSVHTRIDEKGWHSSATYLLPHIDDSGGSAFKEKKAYVCVMKPNGEMVVSQKNKHFTRYRLYDGRSMPILEKLIAKSVDDAMLKTVYGSLKAHAFSWMDEKLLQSVPTARERLKILAFYSRNAALKSGEFLYWMGIEFFSQFQRATPIETLRAILGNHGGKYARKTLFVQYAESMHRYGDYCMTPDVLFAQTIENRDHLNALISLPLSFKRRLFDEADPQKAQWAIRLIKTHYDEAQMRRFFETYLQNGEKELIGFWRDTISMFENATFFESITKNFTPVKLHPRTFHDELVRISHLERARLMKKTKFQYTEPLLELQGEHEGLFFRLPETVYDLDLWSRKLNNCMFNYRQSIHEGRTAIFGIFENGVLKYAVEIREKRIRQAFGAYNQALPVDIKERVWRWSSSADKTLMY